MSGYASPFGKEAAAAGTGAGWAAHKKRSGTYVPKSKLA